MIIPHIVRRYQKPWQQKRGFESNTNKPPLRKFLALLSKPPFSSSTYCLHLQSSKIFCNQFKLEVVPENFKRIRFTRTRGTLGDVDNKDMKLSDSLSPGQTNLSKRLTSRTTPWVPHSVTLFTRQIRTPLEKSPPPTKVGIRRRIGNRTTILMLLKHDCRLITRICTPGVKGDAHRRQ